MIFLIKCMVEQLVKSWRYTLIIKSREYIKWWQLAANLTQPNIYNILM